MNYRRVWDRKNNKPRERWDKLCKDQVFFAKQIVKNGKCEKCEKSRWNVVTTFSVVHSKRMERGKNNG